MAITRVQYEQNYVASSGALNTSQTAGNLIIIVAQGYSYNGTPSSLTCTSTNADVPVKITSALGPNFGAGVVMWYIWNCLSGTPVYSVGGLPDDSSITIYEYAGVDASADPLIDGDSITNSSANPLGVTLTTEANGMILFHWGDEVNLSYSSMNTGATQIFFDTGRYAASAENLSTSAGTTTVNATVSSDVDNMIVAASFREASSGGAASVSPGTGVITYTGYSPVVTATNHQIVLPGTGVVTFTGYSPSVVATDNKNLSPGTGVITYNGFSPSISVSNNINVTTGVGVITYSGFSPTVSATNNISVEPGLGVVTYTGFAPSVSGGGSVNISTGTGIVLFEGFAPTINLSVSSEPGTGQVTFTGYSPIVLVSDHINIQTSTGVVLYTGYSPVISVSNNQSVSPGTGLIVFVGYAPTFSTAVSGSVNVLPGTGLLTFVGYAPRFRSLQNGTIINQSTYSNNSTVNSPSTVSNSTIVNRQSSDNSSIINTNE